MFSQTRGWPWRTPFAGSEGKRQPGNVHRADAWLFHLLENFGAVPRIDDILDAAHSLSKNSICLEPSFNCGAGKLHRPLAHVLVDFVMKLQPPQRGGEARVGCPTGMVHGFHETLPLIVILNADGAPLVIASARINPLGSKSSGAIAKPSGRLIIHGSCREASLRSSRRCTRIDSGPICCPLQNQRAAPKPAQWRSKHAGRRRNRSRNWKCRWAGLPSAPVSIINPL